MVEEIYRLEYEIKNLSHQRLRKGLFQANEQKRLW